MYQIDGRDVLFDWLSKQTDTERRLVMLEWLPDLATNPEGVGHRVPGIRAPVFIAVAPVKPPAVVRYLVAHQFGTIKLIHIGPLP